MQDFDSCRHGPMGFMPEEGEEEQELVMRTIDRAAMAITKAQVSGNPSECSKCSASLDCSRRLRVPQDNIEDAEDNFVADTHQTCTDTQTMDRTVTDMAPGALPAADKRTKDEVDVAAAGIPLEVRRFQCTKSTLALKEATKNDATPQSSKLVHYLVSMTRSSDGMCTEKEMCKWLVAQMCDRMETGQIWVMAKTYGLLSALLWRGSNTFVEAAHEYGKAMFQATHIAGLMNSTQQENITGDRLPCTLQPIESASAGQKSACGKAKPHPGCFIEMMKRKAAAHAAAGKSSSNDATNCVPQGDFGFLISNVAYLESLCEYRMRHPTLDLVHGEILMVDLSDSAAKSDPAKAAVVKKTYSPTAWKELLDDTLELMKAIASTDPEAPICGLGRSAAAARVREAVLLYQIACRALVRLLHSVLTVSHTFVASLQAGLQVPSSNLSPANSPAKPDEFSKMSNYLGVSFDPNALDYSLTPDIVHGFAHDYYHAIYQFNRTVHMLRYYCENAGHLDSDTAKKSLSVLHALPEASILLMKEHSKHFDHPVCSMTIGRLFKAAQRGAGFRFGTGEGDNANSLQTASDVSSPTSECSPLSDEEVRQSMLAVFQFHTEQHSVKERMWRNQVSAVCALFDEKESQMLLKVFTEGIDGLQKQWQEFTNNGAAAAEKAFMDSSSFSSKRTGSNAPGLSLSDNGASNDRSPARHSSGTDSLTRSSTFILRSLPFNARSNGSPKTKSDVISVERTALESSTESAIDALLQEDDVVVICNEECSSNDTLKLIDRFQVLMDVPLGEGSYGKVYRAWDEVIGCYLAAKELPLDASKAHNVAVREVLQEYTVLTELSHPNIVRVVAFMVLKRTARIYMEWMPSGSLQDVLRHHPRGMLRESVVRRYARDVLSGLAFLHSRGVIHRDVKPGNMLLSSDGAVKLTDFGTSLVLSGNHRTLESNSVTGTAAYMAPECVQGTYSSASDIWSFGCSVVQLISGNVPWYNPVTKSSPEPIALLFKIGSLDDTTHLERPHDFLMTSSKAETMDTDASAASLSSLQSPDMELGDAASEKPKDAPSAELMDMLNSIFVVDRKKRPTASQLLQHPFFKIK